MLITTQSALDRAIASGKSARLKVEVSDGTTLVARIPANVKVTVSGAGGFVAHGEGTVGVHDTISASTYDAVRVYAYGRSKVTAGHDATVHAFNNVTVEANDRVGVEAEDNVAVTAWSNSRVVARNYATVSACESSVVAAYDEANVHATDDSKVSAYGRAMVTAEGGSRVNAYGTAVVHADDWAYVTGGDLVTVYRHSTSVTIDAPNVITVPGWQALENTVAWLRINGVPVADGRATLYKAVDQRLQAGTNYGKPTTYLVGTTVTCNDWRGDHECGGGLHVSPAIHHAASYRRGEPADRYLRVSVAVEHIHVVMGGDPKCKVPELQVEAEVDVFGREIPSGPPAPADPPAAVPDEF